MPIYLEYPYIKGNVSEHKAGVKVTKFSFFKNTNNPLVVNYEDDNAVNKSRILFDTRKKSDIRDDVFVSVPKENRATLLPAIGYAREAASRKKIPDVNLSFFNSGEAGSNGIRYKLKNAIITKVSEDGIETRVSINFSDVEREFKESGGW